MSLKKTDLIYLDHSATTPLRSEVFEAMAPYLGDRFGNAGSVHAFGRACRKAVDDAREQVAALLNADPREIIFTSGGTESDNLAVRGIAAASPRERKRVIVSAVEHHAVLHAAEYVQKREGVDLEVVNVDSDGRVDVGEVASLIDDDTVLVSVMHANNETGTIQPFQELAELCAERGAPFHSDTVQSAGKIPIDVKTTPVSMLAVSGHKIYGPKGVGACYVRKGTSLVPQAVGGAQERGRRAGTENVAGIVGLGKACDLAKAELHESATWLTRLRDELENGILTTIPDTCVNGSTTHRLPNMSNVRFKGVEGESILLALDMEGIAVSTGSACTAGSLDPSHVVLAMGLAYTDAQSAVRFSLGTSNTQAQIECVLELLPEVIARLRSASPPTPAPA